ncbi:MAG: DUF6320 domain-containing protein [Coriobacteriales bacterium]|jgi:hypothetical protein|nr:DUF6320 domain-containing protein [Coriobacteriales bacterium]
MRHCDRCGIDFGGELERCPLCQAQLHGRATPSVFPNNVVRKSGTMALKVLAFATGACLLIMLLLGFTLALPPGIVFVVCLALAVNYLIVRNIIIHAPDFLRVVARYFLFLIVITLVWFIVTQNLLITTFVIPSICLLALIYDNVLLLVFRSTFIHGYAKYLLFDMVLGLMPLLLVALGLTTWNLLAFISALAASLSLLWVMIFFRRQLLSEMRKLFSA